MNWFDKVVEKLNECNNENIGCNKCPSVKACQRWFDGLCNNSQIDGRCYSQSCSVIARFKLTKERR